MRSGSAQDAAEQELAGQVSQSAELMKAMTQHVPKRGYYNYLDKRMHQYSAVPRDAYYGGNADTVEAYLREYTDHINGCERCGSWELKRGLEIDPIPSGAGSTDLIVNLSEVSHHLFGSAPL